MYPRTWFDTYWRGTLKPEVFVAMPFASEFDSVWENAIRPAIENDLEGGGKYKAHRVDVTTISGSIVTEILDGIAHATLIFADISMMTTGNWKDQRNGNVMYELGLATAIRPETDMIIVKSDDKDINFDLIQIRTHQYPKDDAGLLDRDCLNLMLRQGDHKPFGEKDASITELLTIRRLLELGIIRCEKTGDYSYIYVWTDFGIAVTKNPNSPAT